MNVIAEDFINLPEEDLRSKYSLEKDGRDWKIVTAKNDLINNEYKYINVLYRPFDKRYSIFTGKSKGFHSYPRAKVSSHLIQQNNIALIVGRQGQAMGDDEWSIIHISDCPVDCNIYYRGRGTVFPLYVYENSSDDLLKENSFNKSLNLNQSILLIFEKKLTLKFSDNHEDNSTQFSPENVINYIYAILHSPKFRNNQKEYLKIDYPRIPYPNNPKVFWSFVKLGFELQQLHLLKSDVIENYITSYPKDGDNTITHKIVKKDWELYDTDNRLGRIWINDQQYFEGIPLIAWEFIIGGYQPAQKWLKDRKGRELSFEDILHYQKIIVALTETDRIMKEIDKIDFE